MPNIQSSKKNDWEISHNMPTGMSDISQILGMDDIFTI